MCECISNLNFSNHIRNKVGSFEEEISIPRRYQEKSDKTSESIWNIIVNDQKSVGDISFFFAVVTLELWMSIFERFWIFIRTVLIFRMKFGINNILSPTVRFFWCLIQSFLQPFSMVYDNYKTPQTPQKARSHQTVLNMSNNIQNKYIYIQNNINQWPF